MVKRSINILDILEVLPESLVNLLKTYTFDGLQLIGVLPFQLLYSY